MLVNKIALLFLRQAFILSPFPLISCSNAHTNHTVHSSSHTNHTIYSTSYRNLTNYSSSHKTKLIATTCSILSHSLTHARIHTHIRSTSPINSTFSTASNINSTASADASTIPSITSINTNACPTYTSTLEAKSCPVVACGPEPIAQIGGSRFREARCVMESTTTMPCGCPTPMATTTVGGCAVTCPPKGCQIDWITAVPGPGSC